jgi:hypothetical protein
MADDYILLSDADAQAIQTLLDDRRQGRPGAPNRPRVGWDEQEQSVSQVYVARLPTDGIPGLTEKFGTGTGTAPLLVAPGFSDNCDIYRVIESSYGSPQLVAVTSFSKRVYNTSPAKLAGNQWLLIERDAYGSWFPAAGGSGVDGRYIRLLAKHYLGDQPNYDWQGVKDFVLTASTIGISGTGTIHATTLHDLLWRYTAEKGSLADGDTALHVNRVDLPVDPELYTGTGSPPPFVSDSIVWARKGQAGNYQLIDQMPHWENVVTTGVAFVEDGVTYYPGKVLRYDQTLKIMCVVRNCRIRAARCVSINPDSQCCNES